MMITSKQLASGLLLVVACATTGISQTFSGVLTQRNDNARTGQNLNETILTPENVSSSAFGKLFSYSVDGQIYAQPLYVANVTVPARGTHNVVFVATENDSVYAFDADGLVSTPLWHASFTNPALGIKPVPCNGTSCVVFPFRGITSTPVIDPPSNTMYLVARTTSNGQYFQSLHALDITTGAEKFGGPVNIMGSVSGTGAGSRSGIVAFDPLGGIQRAGLLLVNGTVYIAWAGGSSQHGWIMGYNAQTLQQVAIFNTTPNAMRGGIWQSGNGLAADSSGNIYAAVADGSFDVNTGGVDYGNTLLKFGSTLNVLDYFTPRDQACRTLYDRDLGSGGPLVLPPQSGAAPNELILAGKGGRPCETSGLAPVYVLNRDGLGQYNPSQDRAVQEVEGSAAGYWSSPAYWQAATTAYLYFAGGNGAVSDRLAMYSLSNGQLSITPIAQSANAFLVGATPSVSSSGTSNGIVWVIARQDSLDTSPGTSPAILYAYDATNVSTMLYHSAQVVQRDQLGCGNKFQVPTVANGKVYVGTQNELDVLGLLGSASPTARVYLSSPCQTFPTQTVGVPSGGKTITLTNSGADTLLINQVVITGTNAADFIQSNNCLQPLVSASSCTVTVQFVPSVAAAEAAYVTIDDNAPGSPHNIYLVGVGQLTALTMTTGNTQTATVATTLPVALQVQATDKSGPVAGVTVTFSDGGMGGNFSGASVVTDSKGFATTSYTLPKTSGTYTITASAIGYSTVSFSERGTPGLAVSLGHAGGNTQSGTVGTILPKQIIAKAVDQYGNGVTGVSITFSDNSAGGTFSANPVVSNSVGLTAVSYTLPTKSQTITVTASSPGLGAITNSETALAGPAAGISVLSGSNQTGPPSTVLTNSLVAQVTDQYGNPVPNISVIFSDGGGKGSFSGDPVVTGFLGKAKVFYTTSATKGQVTINATVGGVAAPATFTETVK
jgi:hypothetical protein